jgi:hypothetical protein
LVEQCGPGIHNVAVRHVDEIGVVMDESIMVSGRQVLREETIRVEATQVPVAFRQFTREAITLGNWNHLERDILMDRTHEPMRSVGKGVYDENARHVDSG